MQSSEEGWRPSARLEAMWQRDVVGPMEDFQDPSQEWRRLSPDTTPSLGLAASTNRTRNSP